MFTTIAWLIVESSTLSLRRWSNDIQDLSGDTEDTDGVGNSLGILCESIPSNVSNIVTSGVVADIESDTSLTTVGSSLGRGLNLLGTSEETTGGNTVLEERTVIGTSREISWEGLDALSLEVILKELLGLGRAHRAGGAELASVAVVDAVEVVRRRDHVEVKVHADLGQVLLGGFLDEVGGAQETLLLSGPPGEADGVVDLESGQLLGDLEETDGAGAVVVETWAGLDGVRVATEVDDIAVVTGFGLSDHVGGGDDVEDNVDGCDLLTAGSDRGSETLTIGLSDTDGRGVVTPGTESTSNDTNWLVVVDDGTDGTGSLRIGDLLREWASSTHDEGNVASNVSTEISGVTADVGDVGDGCSDGPFGGEGHDLARNCGTVDGDIPGGGGDIEILGVIIVVVIVLAQVLQDPGDGGLVSLRADNTSAVAGRELRKVLELVSGLAEVMLPDCLDESLLYGC